ncbi:protein-L-isoaspartate O-methyltransferase [Atractiella rhizophila]|nr:protein-L-isoaspartate O-methyltransferase [Atractiella rhizophila]
MAWRCSGRSNAELIQNLHKAGLIKTERVTAAFKVVDRVNYTPDASLAYEDSPQSIGYGATISAPHIQAEAVENLLPFLKPGAKVLDVGSGSGYLLGIFHQLVQPGGTVYGIDHMQELVDLSLRNLERDGKKELLDNGDIRVVCGDGRKGWADAEVGLFDAIHVGAAAPVMPQALVDQLAKPGRMFIPVGTYQQSIVQVDKDANGEVSQQTLMGVMYVPLTDRKKQWD